MVFSAMLRRTTTLLVALAALLSVAVPTEAGAATGQATSSNWAGYTVGGSGVQFHSVAGTWVQPAASCGAGERRYSAYWLGIGGARSTSTALEQIGTQVNCSSLGEAFYSSWYELVPAGPVSIHLAVHPGDTMSARVTVSRSAVRLYLANRTTGAVFFKVVRPKQLDVTSAEWIVEAPSSCDETGCHTLPLADFGSASFAGATAMNTAGHTGTIADPGWSPTAMALSPDAWPAGPASEGGATPGDLSASGDGFTVTYQGAPAPAPPPSAPY
jgi:hypothetical protein